MGTRGRAVLSSFLGLGLVATSALATEEPRAADATQREYSAATLPLVRRFCVECHSTEEREGDLDLERFARLDQVRNAPGVWQRVGEVLASREMPPREARQPTDAERAQLGRWVNEFLTAEATRRAGDPGRVVLRRLNNAQYTYTLRDLTGLAGLEPAREFPVDGAAGEGFTNTGQALVMSPSLVTKYLDAAKEVASHAVLLPAGIRFSPRTTARDWTEETLTEIRQFYAQFTDPGQGGNRVNLQGIVFETNGGGRLPIERYLSATITGRAALASGATSVADLARAQGLNAKYLGLLWQTLNDPAPSLLIGGLQSRWRTARVEDVPQLVAAITAWQGELWRFSNVGHIGKVGGPKAWMEPVNPLAVSQDIRFKLPPATDGQAATVSLVATDAGAGSEPISVIWREPRIVAPGRPDLPLRDLRRVALDLAAQRERLFAATAGYLDAAAEAQAAPGPAHVSALAHQRGLDPASLRAWCAILGIAVADPWTVTGHFTRQVTRAGGHSFINGWGRSELPQLLTNASDQTVRIPGLMKPRGVAVHPSPTDRAVVGWQSPVSASVRVAAAAKHAHPECGNGVTWTLELRRGATRQRLGAGTAQGSKEARCEPIEPLEIQPGDVLTLAIGPRDGNHACDLTAVDLRIAEVGASGSNWDLAADVAGDVLAGNPHADRLGHPGVWHFCEEPDRASGVASPAIPAGSILARWQAAPTADEKHRIALEVERWLTSTTAAAAPASPDAVLARQLRALDGPLGRLLVRDPATVTSEPPAARPPDPATAWGLDPALFGKGRDGQPIDATSLVVAAPGVVSFRIPAELAAGAELVARGGLAGEPTAEGSAQLAVVAGVPGIEPGPHPGNATTMLGGASWTSTSRLTTQSAPILVNDGTASRRRLTAALDDFRALFPPALCYAKIVPVDEVVTLTLFHREDEALTRLMLDEPRRNHLDRLWDELHFLSRDALTLVDAYAQLMEYASQDGDPRVFEPLRQPINDRAAAFRRRLSAAEPRQVEALIGFAAQAYRRPVTDPEAEQIRGLYRRLRGEDLPHDEAIRLTLARILVAPAFLYRIEKPGPGAGQGPVAATELAARLSYFLWSSAPDRELREVAAAGQLAAPATLVEQTRRLLRDGKARRLAVEFACHWLQIADFDQLDEKSERHFPTFPRLRGAMYEESVRFFTDLFQHDGSVLAILDANHTFLNSALAEHYGIPFASAGDPDEWRRVDGIRQRGRGGVLGQATTLAKQSGASRTSPTLRGNWISEVLLGERLPRPPKGVAQLPDDEAATDGRTVRQLVEQHASDVKCAGCHVRIDPLGFALERFDAIGRRRDKDLGDRAIDTRARAIDGAEFTGLEGLRDYLLTARRDAFVKQFCRKLLGFALGRSTQLSDNALLGEMRTTLQANGYRVGSAIEVIVRSRQFRDIRGRETADTD